LRDAPQHASSGQEYSDVDFDECRRAPSADAAMDRVFTQLELQGIKYSSITRANAREEKEE